MLSKLVSLGIVTVVTAFTGNCLSSSAEAAVFTLDNITFQGGGEATGSFNYDPVSGYSNISITTTPTTSGSQVYNVAINYTDTNFVSTSSSATELKLSNNIGVINLPKVYTLALFFSSLLDNAVTGVSVPILTSSKQTFTGEVILTPERLVNPGGSVSSSAVPEPSSILGFLALGTLGAGLTLKRRLKK